jgi:hypothetical protein
MTSKSATIDGASTCIPMSALISRVPNPKQRPIYAKVPARPAPNDAEIRAAAHPFA